MDVAELESRITDSKLAVAGGKPVRSRPMPPRMAMGPAEIAMLEQAINYYRERNADPGYQDAFEKLYTDEFVAMMGGGYADSVATGTASVFIALAALDLPKGSEVIVSPITDPGTLSAITMNGLKPRLADSQPNDYNIGVQQFVDRIGPNVSAAVIVHATGQATDIDRIVQEAHARGVKIIEDCSQSHGAQILGRMVGTFGDIAAFSTMNRKTHISSGSGGMVYSRNLDIFRQALAHADRGKPRWIAGFDDRNPETFLFPAMNWNTDELSCAIGLASLRRLRDTIIRRLAFVSELAALLDEMDTMFSLLPWRPTDSPFVLPVFVDLARSKHGKIEIAEAVRAEGIGLNPHYRYVVSEWPWLKPYLADDFGTPEALSSRNRSFCLYVNENYGSEEALDVAAALLKVDRAFGSSMSGDGN
ncbi:MAG TPA: DegT/DnrJ/EryC1/StrS family aminotransferase [Burkholderiales bacterium]|nr:DegT/DnrJ/EryC1/StrS family aminotransferase [Burkholderiales bacterium]